MQLFPNPNQKDLSLNIFSFLNEMCRLKHYERFCGFVITNTLSFMCFTDAATATSEDYLHNKQSKF